MLGKVSLWIPTSLGLARFLSQLSQHDPVLLHVPPPDQMEVYSDKKKTKKKLAPPSLPSFPSIGLGYTIPPSPLQRTLVELASSSTLVPMTTLAAAGFLLKVGQSVDHPDLATEAIASIPDPALTKAKRIAAYLVSNERHAAFSSLDPLFLAQVLVEFEDCIFHMRNYARWYETKSRPLFRAKEQWLDAISSQENSNTAGAVEPAPPENVAPQENSVAVDMLPASAPRLSTLMLELLNQMEAGYQADRAGFDTIRRAVEAVARDDNVANQHAADTVPFLSVAAALSIQSDLSEKVPVYALFSTFVPKICIGIALGLTLVSPTMWGRNVVLVIKGIGLSALALNAAIGVWSSFKKM